MTTGSHPRGLVIAETSLDLIISARPCSISHLRTSDRLKKAANHGRESLTSESAEMQLAPFRLCRLDRRTSSSHRCRVQSCRSAPRGGGGGYVLRTAGSLSSNLPVHGMKFLRSASCNSSYGVGSRKDAAGLRVRHKDCVGVPPPQEARLVWRVGPWVNSVRRPPGGIAHNSAPARSGTSSLPVSRVPAATLPGPRLAQGKEPERLQFASKTDPRRGRLPADSSTGCIVYYGTRTLSRRLPGTSN